jgi:isoquinoline 1-oxidoreductase beta subunit
MISLNINGKPVQVDAESDTPLLWVLRDHLDMTGTKFGCGMALCGACTVHVDGAPTRSCVTAASSLAGKRITTIEAIGRTPAGKAVQNAWVAESVPQCGYCDVGKHLPLRDLSAHPGGDQESREVRMIRNLSRRDFLKSSGALVLGVALPVPGLAQVKGEAFAPNAFVRIGADNTVTVIVKHLEMGQGTYTGLPTLVAEELDADWSQMRAEGAPADAARYNNLFWGPAQGTGGSTALANSYEQLRKAGATARAMLVAAAAAKWEVPVSEIRVQKGMVYSKTQKASFGELAAEAAKQPMPADPPLKDPKRFVYIGKANLPRTDARAKSTGTARFTQDVKLPGMLTAVVLHPPRFGA